MCFRLVSLVVQISTMHGAVARLPGVWQSGADVNLVFLMFFKFCLMVFDTCFLLCFLVFLKKVMVQILGGTQTLSRVVDALGGDTDASSFLQHELIKLVPTPLAKSAQALPILGRCELVSAT